MVTNARKNTVMYCLCCGSTIYWDQEGNPILVKYGDQNLLTCLSIGCSLILIRADECVTNFDLFRSRLIHAGIPEDKAMPIAAMISMQNAGAAAA